MSERRLSNAILIGPAAALALLGGCVAHPPMASTDPLVVTEETNAAPAGDAEHEAAVAEIRALAEAAAAPGPPSEAIRVEQTARLAERPEPKSAAEVAAIEAELALIAQRQAASADPAEIAALEARAKELKRLAAAAGTGPLPR